MKKPVILVAFLIASLGFAKPQNKKVVRAHSHGGAHVVNFSLIPDVALYKRTEIIHGFTLSLWGENEQESFALGLVNGFRGNSLGFALGLGNYSHNYKGAQVAVVNWNNNDFLGFQWSFFNYSGNNMKGCQLALVNFAGRLHGIQIGLVNYAELSDWGVQVGIANVIRQNDQWFGGFPKAVAPAMILANWRFN